MVKDSGIQIYVVQNLDGAKRSHSIYHYSNMVLRLSEQTSIFGGVFFSSKSLLGIERQKKLKNSQFLPESLGLMFEYLAIIE